MQLSKVATITHGELFGHDVSFSGCSTDSRHVEKDQMFIALPGDRFDGHQFIQAAAKASAACCMVEEVAYPDISTVRVNNTRMAMGQLARVWRQQFDMPLIAVTGSNGKTTVKEMLRSILSQDSPVLSTIGNLNNNIGVPLTLFALNAQHRYAVIEMGANYPGEIAWLSRISQPTLAVITQCAPAHLEGFGSEEGVAQAKGEIYAGLQHDGIAIINADDKFADFWRDRSAAYKHIYFALEQDADIQAYDISSIPEKNSTYFKLSTPSGKIDVLLPLPGRHNVVNALAAAACAYGVRISNRQIRDGLQAMRPVDGRMQFKKGIHGSRLIDDSYNANPSSLGVALQVLKQCRNKRWLVLGDMGELGEQAESLHAYASEMIADAAVDRLLTLGQLSQHAARSFQGESIHFDQHEPLIDYLRCYLEKDITVLVKGSRHMKMERIVEALKG